MDWSVEILKISQTLIRVEQHIYPLLPGGQLMLEPLEILSLSDLARDQL